MRTLPCGAALFLLGAALAGCVNNANTTRSTSHKPTNSRKAADDNKLADAARPAPEIAGVDADGKKFLLSDYRGKVVLLDFWASW